MSCPNPKSFSRNPEVIGMAQALSVGLMGQQNETYPSWLFQSATRAISFLENAAIVNPIHAELRKAGEEVDVEARIAF